MDAPQSLMSAAIEATGFLLACSGVVVATLALGFILGVIYAAERIKRRGGLG